MGIGMPWLEWVDSQNLGAQPFVLDDLAEEKEWCDYCGIMRSMARLLHTVVVSTNDDLKQLDSATDPCTV
jgi:hypothetical protein